MADDYSQTRIEMLRRRWEQTASPHVSLQLADLYRQSGELDLAVATLTEGLAGNPESVSLRVALGRYQMERGSYAEGVETLGGVVESDPSHLVANKLLVKAFVLLGRLPEARDRLDLYVLINESDPEIETLERSVATGKPLFAVRRTGEARVESDAEAQSTASHGRSLHVVWADGDPFPASATSSVDRSVLAAEGIFFQGAEAETAATEGDTGSEEEPVLEDSMPTAGEGEPATTESEAATTTLGRLYMGQGHLEEAAAVFRSVLETDPERTEARDALAEIEERLGLAAQLEASEIEVAEAMTGTDVFDSVETEAEPSEAEVEPDFGEEVAEVREAEASLAAAFPLAETADPETVALVRRRIDVLRDYLERLGRGRARREV